MTDPQKMAEMLTQLVEEGALLHMDVASLHRRMEHFNRSLIEFGKEYMKQTNGGFDPGSLVGRVFHMRGNRIVNMEDVPDDLKEFLRGLGMEVD